MVREGKAPADRIKVPESKNPLIARVASLKKKPMEQEALNILYDIANAVGPLMKHYGFHVGLLSEMSPKDPRLLGLNVNHGQKIYLRLRPHGNDFWFLPMEDLMGTMIHELTHNLIGPHDVRFYKKMDELADKLNELKLDAVKFGGEGVRLGGRPVDVKRTRLRSSNRLGGVKAKGNLPDLVREAAIKRYEDAKWCHGGEKGDLPREGDLDIVEVSEREFYKEGPVVIDLTD